MENNIITELSELMQRMYGKNIETRVINKEGADHCPVITVEIQLPNDRVYKASGKNKKEAKQKAAQKAFDHFNLTT